MQHEIALRKGDRDQSECAFIGALLRDYLKADAQGQIGASAIWHRQRQGGLERAPGATSR